MRPRRLRNTSFFIIEWNWHPKIQASKLKILCVEKQANSLRCPHKWRRIQFIIESKEQITKITFLSNKFEAGLFQICEILLSAMEMNGNRLFIQSKDSSLMHDFLLDSITHINRKKRFLVDSVMTWVSRNHGIMMSSKVNHTLFYTLAIIQIRIVILSDFWGLTDPLGLGYGW